MHLKIALCALILCVASSASAQQMAPPDLNPDIDLIPLTPPWRADELPLDVYLVGDTPAELTRAQAERSAQQAVAAWDTVGCIGAPLIWRGHLPDAAALPPGAIPIAFVAPSADGCFSDAWDNPALTISDCYAGAPKAVLVNTRDWRWAPDPDYLQQLDPDPDLPKTVPLTAILTHELGHVLGLGHAAGWPLATMAPSYLTDGGMATLSALDRAALCTLYAPEGARSTCEDDAICAARLGDSGASCVTRLDGVRACEEDRGAVGEYCAHNLLVCDGVCYLSSPQTGTGFCTQSCEGDAACPDGWSCQQAGAAPRTVCLPTPRAPEEQGCTSGAGGAPRAPWWWAALWAWWSARGRCSRRAGRAA